MSRSVSVPSEALCMTYGQFDNLEDDWDWFLDHIRWQVRENWPSMHECDRWLNNENHLIMENNLCCFGVSQYNGVVSLWIVAKNNDMTALAAHWVSLVRVKFMNMGTLQKLGTMSNGESVYRERVQ